MGRFWHSNELLLASNSCLKGFAETAKTSLLSFLNTPSTIVLGQTKSALVDQIAFNKIDNVHTKNDWNHCIPLFSVQDALLQRLHTVGVTTILTSPIS